MDNKEQIGIILALMLKNGVNVNPINLACLIKEQSKIFIYDRESRTECIEIKTMNTGVLNIIIYLGQCYHFARILNNSFLSFY